MLPPPVAVIFDYGNVLSLPQSLPRIEQMANRCAVTPAIFDKHYWDLRLPYDRGDLDGPTYWRDLAKRCGCEFSDVEIAELIEIDNHSWSDPNPDMVAVATGLHQRGLKTAILSNMPPDFHAWLPVGVRWLPPFDHATYSCLLHRVKPEPEIYEHCISGLQTAAERCVFIDDRQINIDAAESIGMQTILFTNTETVIAQLERVLSGAQ